MTVEFGALVADIREERRVEGRAVWQVQLEPSVFRPGDTGELRATARSGAMLVVEVLAVAVDGAGELWHTIAKPLATGTAVTARVRRAGRSD